MDAVSGAGREQALHRIVEAVEKLYPLFTAGERQALSQAVDLLTHKILPLLRHECPLLVAVTGGGSVGKSTMFNFLAGGKFSGVKSRAGYTRRTLAAIHPDVASDAARMELLFDLFRKNALPVPLSSPDEMLEPGSPLYVESRSIPRQIAVLDTPDFDTGDKDAFANRAAAEEILVASDVVIYLFTNQTYNIKANTDFVRGALSGIGRRKLLLVYRCSAAYPDEEVGEHIDELLRNLFPCSPTPRAEVLGCYRVDESDAVVRGAGEPVVRALGGGPALMELLTALDTAETRKDSMRSQCAAILDRIGAAAETARMRRCGLVAYRDGVRALASHAVLEGLKNFPQGLLMAQFAECWRETQPMFVRVVQKPGKLLSKGVQWMRGCFRGDAGAHAMPPSEQAAKYREKFLDDFRDSVGKLRSRLALPVLSVDISPAAAEARSLCDALRELSAARVDGYGISEYGDGKATCTVPKPAFMAADVPGGGAAEWMERAADIAGMSDDFRRDIVELVCATRNGMNVWEKTKTWAWAALEVLPPVAAVTWTLYTAARAAGSKVVAHLGGLFGLGELSATLALPESWGLDSDSRVFFSNGLRGAYEKWFARKLAPISALMDEHIVNPCIGECIRLLESTEAPLARLRDAVADIKKLEEDKA